MSLYHYVNRMQQLDALIRHKCTGSPEKLAHKLDISERWLYELLRELKQELDCPIQYDPNKCSYVYEEPGTLFIGFKKELTKKEQRNIGGGRILQKSFPTVCIYSVAGYKL